MNLLTVYLYGSATLVVGLLIACAAHNRKVGWKKQRNSFTEALDGLYADLTLDFRPTEEERRGPVSIQRPVVVADSGAFSLQLINLKGSLGEGTSVTVAPAAARELVTAKGR